MSEIKREIIELSKLKPLEKNVRYHGDMQIEELRKSLKMFNQTRPLVIDEDNNILIGNGVYQAMIKENYTKCDVNRIIGLTESEKKKLIISDNRLYELGHNDYNVFNELIAEIKEIDDLKIPGYDEDILELLVTDKYENTLEDFELSKEQQDKLKTLNEERIIKCPNCGQEINLGKL